MNIILDRFLFLYENCHHVDSKKKTGDLNLNERDFTPNFCFSSIPVIMLIANKKKGVRKESEKRKGALRMRRKEKNLN